MQDKTEEEFFLQRLQSSTAWSGSASSRLSELLQGYLWLFSNSSIFISGQDP